MIKCFKPNLKIMNLTKCEVAAPHHHTHLSFAANSRDPSTPPTPRHQPTPTSAAREPTPEPPCRLHQLGFGGSTRAPEPVSHRQHSPDPPKPTTPHHQPTPSSAAATSAMPTNPSINFDQALAILKNPRATAVQKADALKYI